MWIPALATIVASVGYLTRGFYRKVIKPVYLFGKKVGVENMYTSLRQPMYWHEV